MVAEKTIELTPPQQADSVDLGFRANTCIINNPTASYYFFPDIGTFIPPGTFQAVVPVVGTPISRILHQAPAGLSNPTQVQVIQATFRFIEGELAPSAGLPLGGANQGRGVIWQRFSIAPGFTALVPLRASAPDGLEILPLFNGTAPQSVSLTVSVMMPDQIPLVDAGPSVYNFQAYTWVEASGTGQRVAPLLMPGFFPAGSIVVIASGNTFLGYLRG